MFSSAVKRMFDIVASVMLLMLTAAGDRPVRGSGEARQQGAGLFRQSASGFTASRFDAHQAALDAHRCREGRARSGRKKDDPRITRLGRFIRKVRIDELPQTWSVLKGEMSFVGPRPERPEFVAEP
jgi:lipopolysaccharide/colanic/teichoic acid biosynthesis glycosyltransferase